MDEERKYPDPLALSEAPQCVDQENPAVSRDGMVLSAQGEGSEIAPEESDGVIDSALKGEEVPEPDTELGKQIKAQLDMPASIVNRHIRTETKKLLEKSKPKGKPS